eukprot:g12450.t1
MDNVENDDGLGGESWGDDLLDFTHRLRTDGTDATSEGSDFSPAQLAAIGRRRSTSSAPLPKGVKGVSWQPPSSTGLEHSYPIFETECDKRGALRVSAKGFTSDNCHFRTWQEDNGVAATFASETVEKEVDGQRLTVAIDASARKEKPTTPQRPLDGAASSHARQPRPGRSLSSKGTAVDAVGASPSPKEEKGAEEIRHPSQATEAGGACVPSLVVGEGGVESRSLGIEPAAKAEIGGEVVGQDGQQRQAGDAEGNPEGFGESSGSTPSPKVEETTSVRWWGRVRSPRAPSPQPAQQSKLPVVSVAPGSSDEAPEKKRTWLNFRRRRPGAEGA